MVCHIEFIVIPGKTLRSGNKIPIVKPGISLNLKIVELGFCPIHFTITFAGEKKLIVIPGISLNRRSLNRGSTIVYFHVCYQKWVIIYLYTLTTESIVFLTYKIV